MIPRILVAPAHPMFIPDIGGEHLKSCETLVNGLLKLTLLASGEKIERLIILSPETIRLHHRFAIATGNAFMRAFASHTKHEHIVNLSFPGDEGLVKTLGITAMDYKVPVEPYTQENNITAIDNASLALLYYADQMGWFPKVTIISYSDLPLRKYTDLAKALAAACKSDGLSTAVALLTAVDTQQLEHIQEILEYGQDTSDALAIGEETQEDLWHYALRTAFAFRHEFTVEYPVYHHLVSDRVDGVGYIAGYM